MLKESGQPLLKRLCHISLSNQLHLYLFIIAGLLLSLTSVIGILIAVTTILLARKHLNYIFLIIVIILVSIRLIMLLSVPATISGKAVIYDIKENQYNYTYVIKYQFSKYEARGNFNLDVGDKIVINADVVKYRSQTIENGFNLRRYKLKENIKGELRVKKLENLEKTNYLYQLRSRLKDSNILLVNMLFNNVEVNDQRVSFIFSMSAGLIYGILLIINQIMFYLNAKDIHQKWFNYVFLGILLIIFNHYIILYCLLSLVLKHLNQVFNEPFNALDIKALCLILMLVLRIELMFSYSFIILAIFILSYEIINPQGLLQHILPILILLPFQIAWYNEINLLLLLLSPVIYYLFRKNLMLFIFFSLGIFYQYDTLITLLTQTINYLDSYYGLVIKIRSLNQFLVVIYCLTIIYILLENSLKKRLFRIAIVGISWGLIFLFLVSKTDNYIYFLDVGQGDGCVISYQHKIVVVDAYQNVGSYLKSKGVRNIDYLILTHNDLDHTKEAQDLLNDFKVKTLIISDYQNFLLKHDHTIVINANNLITLPDIDITFYAPFTQYQNKNDNSLIFSYTQAGIKTLFTGDISMRVENDFLLHYPKLTADIIKIAHHGAATSSSALFLSQLNIKAAIISAGFNNRYQHPHPQTLQTLQDYAIEYKISAFDGSTKVKMKKDSYYLYNRFKPYGLI